MKKLLLSAALVASTLTIFAQTPAVPNGGFEDWSTGACGDVPTGYLSDADLINEDFGGCPTSAGITKSTDKYSGTYALQLTSLSTTILTTTIYAGNAIYSGTSVDDVDGIDFNGRPTKLVGYTKFTKAGSDTLGIYVDIMDDNGDFIGSGELSITSTQSDYTRFEITIIYDATNTNDPVNLGIAIGFGNASNTASPNSIVLIDAFSFEYPTTTSTVNYSATSPINVYAENKTINFSDNVSDIQIVNMVGASKMQEPSTTKTLNAASLTTGMYIVTYKYNDAYFSKKVVIE